MTAVAIFRDWRVGMIAGAALLHLTAFAGAWVMTPHDGVETRLNRPIEASLMPAPSNEAVDEASTPLAQEVVSPVVEADQVVDNTAEVVPPDAVPAAPVTPPETVAPTAVETAKESPATPVEQDKMAALTPDVVTTTSTQASQTATTAPETVPTETVKEPSEPVTPKSVVEKPKKKAELPKEAPLKKKAVEHKPDVKRLAKLDTTTQIPRAQQGGRGAMSDIGVAESTRTSGAALQKYNAILVAAVNGRVRSMGGISCQGGSRASVAFNVSVSGGIGGVRLSGPSGDSALDRAALAAVRSISPPPPPGGAVSRVIPIRCPRS